MTKKDMEIKINELEKDLESCYTIISKQQKEISELNKTLKKENLITDDNYNILMKQHEKLQKDFDIIKKIDSKECSGNVGIRYINFILKVNRR